MGPGVNVVNVGVEMGSRKAKSRERGHRTGFFRSVKNFILGASRSAFLGLGVAIGMGVVFGLAIGIGGAMLNIEPERLYVYGGMSGWVSGLVAMLYVFIRVWRQRHELS